MATLLLLLLLLGALSAPAAAQSLCGQYDGYQADGYSFNNNMWGKDSGSGKGCTVVDRGSNSGVAYHVNWQWSGGQNNVKQYAYAGRVAGMKKLVGSIGSMPSSAAWSYSGSNLRADVAYDMFTAADANHATSSGDYELMIWLARLGDVEPIGSKVATVNVCGQNWELWDGFNGAMHTFSFVATNQLNYLNGDIKQFFDYLKENRGFPAASQYLISAQFGTEAFTGDSACFTVSDWSLGIN